MKLTLRQLNYAIATARYGSLTAAADALHISQPSISTAISQIEDYFGKALFVRQRGTGISLTAFGQSVLSKAKEVLADVEALEALADEGSVPHGEFVLGCFEDLAPYCVPPILARIARAYPAIHVIIREAGFDTLGRHLDDGVADLAITYDLGLPTDVVRIVLCELSPQALLPADHALSRQASVTLAELAREPLILTDQAQSWQHMLELFQSRGVRPQRAVRTGSFELQRGMVANGLGVAIAYSRPFSNFSYDGQPLVRKPIADPLPLQRILLAHSEKLALSAAHRVFIDEARTWFAEKWPVPHAAATREPLVAQNGMSSSPKSSAGGAEERGAADCGAREGARSADRSPRSRL
jgi:DNA-binding transcriptional LysR family regulator